jgi:hypothetical protein
MQMQQVLKVFLVGLTIVLLPTVTMADLFSPGEPNSWNNTTPMTETLSGSGIWEYTWTGFADPSLPDTHFDILSVSGVWDSKVHPSGNQWVTPDGANGNTLSLDQNSYADGWFPVSKRVGVASESVMSWTAVGDWQNQVGGGDWDISNAFTAMTHQGGGIFSLTATLSAASYNYKAVRTDSWYAIGGNSRNVNADNFGFTVPVGATSTTFLVNVLDGTIKVQSIPEPSAFLYGGLISLLAGCSFWVKRRLA